MQTTVELFKSLADETRLRLLVLLSSGGEFCVCDLLHALAMPQSTVSRHLAYLKRHGWLQDRRGGVWMYYSLKRDLPALLTSQLALIVAELADTPACRADRDRLEAYLHSKSTAACA